MNTTLLSLAGLLAGGFFALIYEKTISKITGKNKVVVSGYKLHHSLYGALLMVLALFYPTNAILFVSAGLGIIGEHYVTGGGFDFITKERNKR